jgi:REP element-mobilizing transposase RayT
MEKPHRKLEHESPEWVGPEAEYFITVCACPKGKNHFCHEAIGATILETIEYRHRKGIWICDLAVLMPDHIHLILSFPDVPSFAKTVGEWKRWLARAHHISWQEDFFDTRLRSELDRSKAEYILQNPVRGGLVKKPEDWPWIWMPKE